MAQKPSIPKGTRDFSPAEVAKRNYIFSKHFNINFSAPNQAYESLNALLQLLRPKKQITTIFDLVNSPKMMTTQKHIEKAQQLYFLNIS